MIRIDYRRGSGELEHLFHPFGIKVVKTTLDFGDFDFIGRGPTGDCAVVIERKRIEDLVQSMESRRLSGHQLPGMAREYDYCYLIVEGIWRPGANGELEVFHGKTWRPQPIHYRAIDNYLGGLELRAGVIYRRTSTDLETVFTVVDLYRMWTEKAWHEHKAHDAVYTGGVQKSRHLSLPLREVGIVERVAMQLPRVDNRARWVAKRFKTLRQMIEAGEREWKNLPWRDKNGQMRRLGPTTAKKIVAAISGREA